MEGHDSAINSLSTVTINHPEGKQQTIVASASADSTVKIWNRPDSEGRYKYHPDVKCQISLISHKQWDKIYLRDWS